MQLELLNPLPRSENPVARFDLTSSHDALPQHGLVVCDVRMQDQNRVLDEFHAGRMLEVGDIIASRLRMITAGIERGTWALARRFLVYHQQDLTMVSDELMDEALKVDALEKKREKALQAAKSEAPRR